MPPESQVPSLASDPGSEAGSSAFARFPENDDDLVRVFSFGGGGFDTVMQLGSVHALLAIQGKAPDAVIGLSAGCVNAIALAEVMQAGEEIERSRPWAELADPQDRQERQQRRLEARVTRFFEILDRLMRAPGEVIDGLLPDGYQVDARKPLQTVRSPIFVQDERARRDEAVANRTGLVKLYNHVLGVGLTFGTMTRIARRMLGFTAAGDLRSDFGRFVVRGIEVLRIWVLIGTSLTPISRVVKSLMTAPLRAGLKRLAPDGLRARLRQTPGYTAGAIIFRFPSLEAVVQTVVLSAVWVLVVSAWVTITIGLLLLPWGAAKLSGLLPGGAAQRLVDNPWLAYVLLLPILGAIGLVTWRTVREFDRTTTIRIVGDVIKSSVFTAGLIAVWTFVVFLILTVWGTVSRVASDIVTAAGENGLVNAARGVDYVSRLAAGGTWAAKDVLWSDQVWRWFAREGLVVAVGVTALIMGARLFSRPGGHRGVFKGLLRMLLDSYQMKRSLFSSYAVERLCADLFDPHYWGAAPIDEVVEDALADRLDPWPGDRPAPPRERKLIGRYFDAERLEPIRVGIAAANLETGSLELIEPRVSVVGGLTAALSVVPLFPPKRICGKYFVDGANITNEPMQGAFQLLKDSVPDRTRAVHVYAVTPLPTTSRGRVAVPRERPRLVATTRRARELRRLRDATLERRLTELYSQVLPSEGYGVFPIPSADGSKPPERRFVRSWVTPVEPDRPIDVNLDLLRADKNESRRLLLESLADGCRATLQAMIAPSLRESPGALKDSELCCSKAVEIHLAQRRERAAAQDRAALSDLATVELPAKCRTGGAGLGTVCEYCALRRDEKDEAKRGERKLAFSTTEPLDEELAPPWPHERETGRVEHPVRLRTTPPETIVQARRALAGIPREEAGVWPRPIENVPKEQRPVRSLLFSGGVFRGVFQMGVVNALADLELRPDLIAGASVGSITAAMTAAICAQTDATERARLVARLSSVYLALDRMILTDRFADFVRNLTVRAADADFSVRQADRVFRRFNATGVRSYGGDARRVLAGLEQLFYMSPFEVTDLVRAIRHRDRGGVYQQLERHTQEWLDRMDVGEEVLGADPLQRLIQEYVVTSLPRDTWRFASGPSFDDLRTRHGIHFLATTTNLVQGNLEVLGMVPRQGHAPGTGAGAPSLTQGLLASSAFPGVFRAREAHEVFPTCRSEDLYLDGGIIDNFPIDAVAEFLLAACTEAEADGTGRRIDPSFEPLIARRPRRVENGKTIPLPHLVFSASLEVQPRRYVGHDLERLSWPELMARTRQLGYNRKVDQYEKTQRNLRAIEEWVSGRGSTPRQLESLDLEIVVVKPKWLCKTFAFHPMLGFRRDRQAQSIAHGCASTLVELARRREEMPEAVAAWGINMDRLPRHTSIAAAFESEGGRTSTAGMCWLRDDILCPYSDTALSKLDLPPATRNALTRIHDVCSRRSTHGPKERSA